MDLALNETQTMIREMAADFVGRELSPTRVREIDESDTGFAQDLWRQMGDFGWPGMAIPEEFGGTGNSLTDLGVLHEVLGGAACSSPLLSSGLLGAQAILEAGDRHQKQALLPAVARGELILSFAFTEPDYGWGPESVQLSAATADGGFALNGHKLFVADAHAADQLIVLARTSTGGPPEQGLSMFLVDKGARGLSVRRQTGWLGDNLCHVTLDNVELPASALLGEAGFAWAPVERTLDRATAVLCACMLGGAQQALDMAVEYAKTRVAFGVPIGTFQRVQDRIIDALNAVEAMRWTTYEALWKLDEGREDAAIAVSTAKAVASDQFPRACDASHHVHAGIGTDLNYGLTHHTKRARTFQHYLGDANHHRKRLAGLLNL